MSCVFDGYDPCHNSDDIVAAVGYDPEADLENTPHSVFCDHGAGFVVPWQEVDNYKHLEADISPESGASAIIPRASGLRNKYKLSDEDLEAIMLKAFGPIKRRKYTEPKIISSAKPKHIPKSKTAPRNRKMLIIDGYNVIYSWDELKEIADFSLEKARETLLDILSNYSAFTKTELTVVFDAYLVKDGVGSDILRDGYRVIYTKKDQTADAYIEQMMHDLGPDYTIHVVTGDRLVQFSAVHSGILRMTSKEFYADVSSVGREINEFIKKLSKEKN